MERIRPSWGVHPPRDRPRGGALLSEHLGRSGLRLTVVIRRIKTYITTSVNIRELRTNRRVTVSQPVTVIARFAAQPQKRPELHALLEAMIAPTRSEKGCRRYD